MNKLIDKTEKIARASKHNVHKGETTTRKKTFAEYLVEALMGQNKDSKTS